MDEMNESKVRELKWILVKHKGCVLHFSLKSSNTKPIFGIWKFKSTKKKKKKKKKQSPSLALQCNEKPEKINFINKPIFTSLTSNKKSRHKKKKKKKNSNKANGTLGRMDDLWWGEESRMEINSWIMGLHLGILGFVWWASSNTHFHILNNFTHISTHFFTNTYIKNI